VTPHLALLAVAPVEYCNANAFRDYADGTGDFGPVRIPVYPSSQRGAELRATIREAGIGVVETAQLLGIGVADIVYLSQGQRTLSDEDWTRVFEVVRAEKERRG
jgi:hypothetical protein